MQKKMFFLAALYASLLQAGSSYIELRCLTNVSRLRYELFKHCSKNYLGYNPAVLVDRSFALIALTGKAESTENLVNAIDGIVMCDKESSFSLRNKC